MVGVVGLAPTVALLLRIKSPRLSLLRSRDRKFAVTTEVVAKDLASIHASSDSLAVNTEFTQLQK